MYSSTSADFTYLINQLPDSLFLVMLGLGVFTYFLPGIIAGMRNHDRSGWIALFNILFGWTLFGWIASLAWACSGPAHPSAD